MSGRKDGLIVAVLVGLLCVLFASLFLYNKDTMVCVWAPTVVRVDVLHGRCLAKDLLYNILRSSRPLDSRAVDDSKFKNKI